MTSGKKKPYLRIEKEVFGSNLKIGSKRHRR
jgi:hypothetical protein